jgi:hypothetical protein
MTKRKDEYSVVTYEKQEPVGECPAGIKRTEYIGDGGELNYFFPAVTDSAYNNLYGRLMTLLEATTDKDKLKVVKNLFQREINDWYDNLEKSVKEIDERQKSDSPAEYGYYYKNVYVYPRTMGRAIRGDHPEIDGIDI